MLMKNPPHPGNLIKDDIEALGLSVAEAAKGLGVTRQQLYRVIAGQHAITPEMAVRLEQAFGGSADTWLRAQMSYDLAQVRALAPIRVVRLKRKVPAKRGQAWVKKARGGAFAPVLPTRRRRLGQRD